MEYYHEKIKHLQDDFYDTLEEYPLFHEMIDEIYDRDIKEINELLEKNDEFYLKKVISKLEDVINYIKDTNRSINKEYDLFDKLSNRWQEIKINTYDDKYLDEINSQVDKANKFIKSHNLEDIKEANKIMQELIKKLKK